MAARVPDSAGPVTPPRSAGRIAHSTRLRLLNEHGQHATAIHTSPSGTGLNSNYIQAARDCTSPAGTGSMHTARDCDRRSRSDFSSTARDCGRPLGHRADSNLAFWLLLQLLLWLLLSPSQLLLPLLPLNPRAAAAAVAAAAARSAATSAGSSPTYGSCMACFMTFMSSAKLASCWARLASPFSFSSSSSRRLRFRSRSSLPP